MPELTNRTSHRFFGSLQEAYDRLDAIIENSYDGIYITDGQAITLRINRAYETITGMKAEEVLGRSMWELEKAGTIDRSGTLIALSQRRPVTMEQEFRTGRRALISSAPVFDDLGNIVMVVTNVRDMTDLYHLQQKYQEKKELSEKLYSEIEFARNQVLNSADLLAVDARMLEMLDLVRRVAVRDTTVLLLGETGVGKEKVAKYIYKNSARRDGRFLTVNCGAIPPNLMESELFGYEKGAFTGANRNGKPGLFELADKGTVFLDEVGELPKDMQVKLLRVLQERSVTRIGGDRAIPVDVRVLAATNRDLEEMVRNKTFREDLYYRLSVVPITIPPLRERRDDIIPFAQCFLEELCHKYNIQKSFDPMALQTLLNYEWPGNVRELRNMVERVVITAQGDTIYADDLPFSSRWNPTTVRPSFDAPVDLKALTEQFEMSYIRRAYEKYGNVRQAAASLGMDASTFVRKRQKYERASRLLQK